MKREEKGREEMVEKWKGGNEKRNVDE